MKNIAANEDFKKTWMVIRSLKTFTLDKVSIKTGLPVRPTLYKIIDKMKDEGMVKVKEAILPRVYEVVIEEDLDEGSETAAKLERDANTQAVWNHIRHLKSFTMKMVAEATGLDIVRHLLVIMTQFESAGIVEVDRTTKPHRFTMLIENRGLEVPEMRPARRNRPTTGTERMWKCMKVLRHFTVKDLTLYAGVSDDSAKTYIRLLQKASYLTAKKSDRGDVFIFNRTRDTGPFAPAIIGRNKVFDRNTQKVVWKKS